MNRLWDLLAKLCLSFSLFAGMLFLFSVPGCGASGNPVPRECIGGCKNGGGTPPGVTCPLTVAEEQCTSNHGWICDTRPNPNGVCQCRALVNRKTPICYCGVQ